MAEKCNVIIGHEVVEGSYPLEENKEMVMAIVFETEAIANDYAKSFKLRIAAVREGGTGNITSHAVIIGINNESKEKQNAAN